MEDSDVLKRINDLAHEEHALWEKESSQTISDDERRRLRELQVTLDQCWDLMHQRRARRAAGLSADDTSVRDAATVEGYEG